MKHPLKSSIGFALALSTILASGAFAGTAPSKNKSPKAPADSGTNIVAKSVFTIPENPSQGRDPFFPERAPDGYTSKAKPVVSNSAVLVLQGISGTANNRLAIINGRTLAEGETAEVSSGSGSSRVRIQCVEITDDSATVKIGNERRQLQLGVKSRR
jgi:hypothetical protein